MPSTVGINPPKMNTWSPYSQNETISNIVESTNTQLNQQWSLVSSYSYLSNYWNLSGNLLDWVVELQYGIIRPPAQLNAGLWDFGDWDSAKWDERQDIFLINDMIFKKYIFWETRRDIEFFSVPSLITQICDFCNLQRSQVDVSISVFDVTVALPLTPLTQQLKALATAGRLTLPLNRKFEFVLI